MRRTETVTIQDEGGRDHGKTFVLTEMPAIPADKWATQALSLIMANGLKVAETEMTAGMEGLAAAIGPDGGTGLDAREAMAIVTALQHPSLESWWDCVQYQHKPNQPPMPIDKGENCPIEDIATIGFLRFRVLALHTGFFSPANGSTSGSRSPPVKTGSRPTKIYRRR